MMDGKVVSDLAGVAVKLVQGPSGSSPAPRYANPERFPRFHTQPAIPGVELHNYTNRVPDEDGKYVVVTTHTERIELIVQEPTAAEIKEQKEEMRFRLVVVCSAGVFIAGAFCTLKYFEGRRKLSA